MFMLSQDGNEWRAHSVSGWLIMESFLLGWRLLPQIIPTLLIMRKARPLVYYVQQPKHLYSWGKGSSLGWALQRGCGLQSTLPFPAVAIVSFYTLGEGIGKSVILGLPGPSPVSQHYHVAPMVMGRERQGWESRDRLALWPGKEDFAGLWTNW